MTGEPLAAEPSRHPDPERPRPFLTVVARSDLAGPGRVPEAIEGLLRSTRLLLLFPSGRDRDMAPWMELAPGARVVLMADQLEPHALAREPDRWFERALRFPGCRPDAVGRDCAALVNEALEVLVHDPRRPEALTSLGSLQREDFAAAWNRHLHRVVPQASLGRVVRVVSEAGGGDAERASTEALVRELVHERDTLRLNRDLAREEHLAELQEHRDSHESAKAELEACYRELGSRAAIISELREVVGQHERELERYGRHVAELEELCARTRAHRIAKWLDRLGRGPRPAND